MQMVAAVPPLFLPTLHCIPTCISNPDDSFDTIAFVPLLLHSILSYCTASAHATDTDCTAGNRPPGPQQDGEYPLLCFSFLLVGSARCLSSVIVLSVFSRRFVEIHVLFLSSGDGGAALCQNPMPTLLVLRGSGTIASHPPPFDPSLLVQYMYCINLLLSIYLTKMIRFDSIDSSRPYT